MEGEEVVEIEAVVGGLDEGFDRGMEVGDFDIKAEKSEGLADLVDADEPVLVFVEHVEDAT